MHRLIDAVFLMPGHPEVGHLGVALETQQVLRLDVAVAELLLAQIVECLGRLTEASQQFVHRNAGQTGDRSTL